MLIPIFAATIVFFIALVILSVFIPGLSIFLAAVIAGFVYFGSIEKIKRLNRQRDSARVISYYLSGPQAYVLVENTLKAFRWRDRKWQLIESDEARLSMQFLSEWKEESFKGMKLLGPDAVLLRQVFLRIKIWQDEINNLTSVESFWNVNSPLHRAECNALQDRTRQAIDQVLSSNQTEPIDIKVL
jgi:hypothetical protein